MLNDPASIHIPIVADKEFGTSSVATVKPFFKTVVFTLGMADEAEARPLYAHNGRMLGLIRFLAIFLSILCYES